MTDQELIELLLYTTQGTTDKYGNPESYDLDTQNKQGTRYGKITNLLDEPMFAGGPGAYDPSAFDPVVDRVDRFDVPADPLAPYMTAAAADSIEGYIARNISQGFTPSQIIDELNAERKLTSPQQAESMTTLATDLFSRQGEYQSKVASLPTDPTTGQPMTEQVTYRDSDAAQRYRDQGLPLPTDRFTEDDFSNGGYSRGLDAMSQALMSFKEASVNERQAQGAADAMTPRQTPEPDWLAANPHLREQLRGNGTAANFEGGQPVRGGRERMTLTDASNARRSAQQAMSRASVGSAYDRTLGRRGVEHARRTNDTPLRRVMIERLMGANRAGI